MPVSTGHRYFRPSTCFDIHLRVKLVSKLDFRRRPCKDVDVAVEQLGRVRFGVEGKWGMSYAGKRFS